MGSYETPEEEQRRKLLLSKFTMLNVQREQKRRLRIQLEEKKPEPVHAYNPWKTAVEKEIFQQQQLEYIKPYIDEYKTGHKKPDNEKAQNDDQTNDDCESTISATTVRTDVTVCQKDDMSSQLAFIRNFKQSRKRQVAQSSKEPPRPNTTLDDSPLTSIPRRPKAPSTCNQFEMTSTIMPPTEVASGDYESNVTVGAIRQKYFKSYKLNEQDGDLTGTGPNNQRDSGPTKLPIYSMRRQIIDSINSYSVVIIEGATGCGKTTQVPAYLLEEAILGGSPEACAPVIYVTQPRRIAAQSIAKRVCDEHNWQVGSIVGYQVGLDKAVGPDTILVFCTAGVLLQKIIQEKSLKKYTHIIIDEVHERDADTDLLLMMIRNLMFVEMPVFRLIVMSATMDSAKLRKYFTFKTSYGHQAETTPSYIPIGVSSRAKSSIQTVYLDTLRSHFNIVESIPDFDIEQAELHEDCLKAAVILIADVVPRLDNYNEKSKSTLVFLPGLAEISKMERLLRKHDGPSEFLDIIPCHSCLSSKDQHRIYEQPRPGCRKVILATNIAESSLTVPDAGFIVDFCLTKTLRKDTITKFPVLKLQWATQDRCTQRSGRTGRCCDGKVFRMVPQNFFKQFDEFAEPELLTAPLEISVLRVKSFRMGEIKAMFAVVMDPPPFNEIRTAVLELKQIGALAATYNGQLSDIDGDLTELGRVISALPIDVHLSKLVVVASVFDVLQDAIIVAACLSTNRTVVQYSFGNKIESYVDKLRWAGGTQSDLFMSLECYKEFKMYKEDKHKASSWLRSWCQKNNLDERKLNDVDAMVFEISNRLENVNIFANIDRPNQIRDANMDYLMLKVAFSAAFYPNYFLTSPLDCENIKKELNGQLDPTKTVIFHGLPMSQVPIYKSQILEYVPDAEDFDFLADHSKAFLIYNDENTLYSNLETGIENAIEAEGKHQVLQRSRTIPLSVYKAVKMGETDHDIVVREFREDAAIERVNFYFKQLDNFSKEVGHQLIPTCLKVLHPDQEPDNRCLLEADPKEYMEIYERRPFVEVAMNVERDDSDLVELHNLVLAESKLDGKILDHPIYKPDSRRIRGPDSPIKMSFQSVLYKSKGFAVMIDQQSVNSVLLDPEYAEARRQMLVAASVEQSNNGRVKARDTTLMPNVRGLPTLMALLFAQYYRLIYNNELNCFAGAVFGIGWTKDDDQPLDRDYQVDLGFDVHITMNDIALINSARRKMSQLLKFTEIQNAGKPQASLQEDLRNVILTLMRTRRYPLNELDISLVDYPRAPENIFTKDMHNMSDMTDSLRGGDTRPFLPIVTYSRDVPENHLYERIRENLILLQKINDELESIPRGGVKCLLCGNGYKSVFILGLNVANHLMSANHLKKLGEFEQYEARFQARNQS